MSRLKWTIPVIGAAALAAALGTNVLHSAPNANKADDLKQVTTLPISKVVLFSSGVGYFARSAEIDGSVRVDLTFPENDINDLLKSMTLQDFGGGTVAAVSYDSREPISRTLSSFAINLNNNPTFAGILSQIRGEKVEVTLLSNVANQPGTLSGTIVGIERKTVPDGKAGKLDTDVLNIWCADGMRTVKLDDIARLRFLNPVIENEFRRALEVLALSHDAHQKKAVSLHFAGDGKRKVEVGYVIENPIWKTSYRLVLDKDGKPYLQGWAIVENPTDEDWSSVSMALISGRPISFKMDLYNPLYVDRPTVEPELFASLRPVTYSGDMLARKEKQVAQDGLNKQAEVSEKLGQSVAQAKNFRGRAAAAPMSPDGMDLAESRRATKPELEQARQFDESLGRRMNLGAAGNAATAGQLGDYFQYIINHPVNLNRQKSALLPIVGKEIEGQRVSIYNPQVQAKHPLLGLKFKNTTGLHLSQGPITVFEGSTYAGDTRILDVQPNEERLVSYAIDLGTEVNPKVGNNTSRITNVRAVKGVVYTTTRIRDEKIYEIANRSTQNRTLLIEHANRENQQFKVVSEGKPIEKTAEVYRFQTEVKAGESKSFTVTEERDQGSTIQLTNSSDDTIRYFISLNEASAALKAKLQEALTIKGKWDSIRREIQKSQTLISTITQDQQRLRANLRETPKEAEVYGIYLKKFNDQEKEMDSLHAKLKDLQEQEHTARVTYETFLQNLTVE